MTGRKKLAVILSRFPYPLDKGDKLRAFQQIKYLARFHDVYLYALSDEDVNEERLNSMRSYCQVIEIYRLRKIEIVFQAFLSLLKGIPVQVGYFYSPSLHQKMTSDLLALQPDIIYCQLSRTALYGKDLPFKKIIDFQDAFSTNYERMQNSYNGVMKYFYRREASCMRKFEIQMTNWFDESTIISEFDRQKIQVKPNQIVVVSNGVDSDYFRNKNGVKKIDLLFVGNLSYLPNKKAVHFLVEEIAPKLIQLMPEITIEIVGAFGDELKKYESENISVRGWVNDIRVAYEGAKIFVAPLFTGAGLQNKLLEAMSMGVPCVTTSITNASLLAVENKHLLIADNADDFVFKIVKLLEDEMLCHQLSVNARDFIMSNFNWDVANRKLLSLLEK